MGRKSQQNRELRIEEWHQKAAKKPELQWVGNLSDDFQTVWSGLCLRAERINSIDRWWAVFDVRTGIEIDYSNRHDEHYYLIDAAQEAVEKSARVFVLGE